MGDLAAILARFGLVDAEFGDARRADAYEAELQRGLRAGRDRDSGRDRDHWRGHSSSSDCGSGCE